MGVASVKASTARVLRAGPGSTPRAALHDLRVRPIPFSVAKAVVVREHYLHSMPGGSCVALGVFTGKRLMGVVILGVGPSNIYCLVDGAGPDDCLALTRFWLNDALPANSESRVIGVMLRSLKRDTSVRFLVTYADPAAGHLGIIYQATGWLYTGFSQAMPLLDLGDGVPRHSRSLAHAYGTHSRAHFAAHGVKMRLVPQSAKHRYVFFLDATWRIRLRVSLFPYPKKGEMHANH